MGKLHLKKIVIFGASGFIGRALVKALRKEAAAVTVVGRSAVKLQQIFPSGVEILEWNGTEAPPWSSAVNGAYAVINLVGETIATRWNEAYKQAILKSRVQACQKLSSALASAKQKPTLVLQASAIGIYGNRGEEILDESSQPGFGFLATVAQEWEKAITVPAGTKLAILRLGVVLGPEGGFLAKVVPLFKFFLGGHIGSGKQYISWIHLEDVIGAMLFLLQNPKGGIYNLTAPQPVMAKNLFYELGKVLQRPSWLPAPAFAIKLLYGEMAEEVLLAGQRVLPVALQQVGYTFQYPELRPALQSLAKNL